MVGLLAATVGLRAMAAGLHPTEFADAEEFFHLRLARQVLGGWAVQDIETFWFRAGPGPNGGPLVLSVAYLPLVWLWGAGTLTLRIMACSWAVATAVMTGATARELVGRGGAVAGVAGTLALPPAWVILSTTSKGNHVEGTVLALACCWLLLLLRRRPSRGLAVALGGLCVFSAWFADIAAGTAGLAMFIGLWGRTRSWTILGAVAMAPLFLVFGPHGDMMSPLTGSGEVVAVLRAMPGKIGPFLAFSFLDVPVFDTPQLPVWSHCGDNWLIMQRAISGMNWVISGAALLVLARRSPGLLVPLLALVVPALALPVVLGLAGMGPESLPEMGLPRGYFWEPRRLVLVYPLWALSWAVVVAAPGLGPWVRRCLVVWMLVAVGLTFSVLLPGEDAPRVFRPERYLLCPAETPAHELDVCVPRLGTGDAESLNRLLSEPTLDRPRAVRAGLEGWASVEGDGSNCRGIDVHLSEPSVRQGRSFWLGLGHGSALRCSAELAAPMCDGAPSPELRSVCLRAAAGAGPTHP